MNTKQEKIFTGIRQKRKIAKEILKECHSYSIENLSAFNFIDDKKLHLKITTSYREAIFVNSLTKVLSINRSDSYPFNEIQTINYASICEAILGYICKSNVSIAQSNTTDKLGRLVEMNIITLELEKEIRSLWEIRNNVHLYKAKTTNQKFFKKHLINSNRTVIELCTSIQTFLLQDSIK